MKNPIVQIWVYQSALVTIQAGKFPSSWWTWPNEKKDIIQISVSLKWFLDMKAYVDKLDKDSDLPF